MPDFLLPDLGEGLDEAQVITWRVRPGDEVAIDQIVVEVETAKAAVEVPVPFAGTVAALHAAPGTTVKVGQPLITVDSAARADGASSDAVGSSGFLEPGAIIPDTARQDEPSGNVLIGYGTSAASSVHRRRSPRRRPGAGRQQSEPERIAAPAESIPATGVVPVISPLVRRQARDAGIDLATVRGTGRSGVVRRSDVDAATHTHRRGPSVQPDVASAASLGETRVPLRGLRRTAADKLSRSRREIPEATVWVDVDATELLAARAALNLGAPEQPVSLLALLARFTVLALRRYPELNAHIEADEIVIPDHVHLGFAAQTERGLVVPVVLDAHRLSTRELSAALAQRISDARAGQLSPAALTGGTITVNNYGGFGVDGSAAIINFPEVAIVGLGRIIDRPWVVDGQIVVRKISQLTLAFDHRVCDGGTAGGFLRYIADCMETPVIALGDL